MLHAMGEIVDRHAFLWRTAPHTPSTRTTSPRTRCARPPELHRRIDVDYNGWWMCLIPREVVRDDRPAAAAVHQVGRRRVRAARQGSRVPDGHPPRARRSGTCPGRDKDDASDWQAYFHARNRLVAAALHSPYDDGGGIFRQRGSRTTSSTCSRCEYSTVALHMKAYEDFLAGPAAAVRPRCPRRWPTCARCSEQYPDGRVLILATCPTPAMDAVVVEGMRRPPSARWPSPRRCCAPGAGRYVRPVPRAPDAPQLQVPAPGRPVVPALAPGQRHRGHRRRPRRHLPAPRPGDVPAAAASTRWSCNREIRRRFPELQQQYRAAVRRPDVRGRPGPAFESLGDGLTQR